MIENPKNIVPICSKCAKKMHEEWQNNNKDAIVNVGDYVKIKVKEGKKNEHLWFEVTSVTNNKDIIGRCDNEPQTLKKMKFNDVKPLTFSDIEALIRA